MVDTMKKSLILLVIILMLFSLCGCSNKEDKPSISVRYLTDVNGTESAITESVINILKTYSQNYNLNLHAITPSSNSDYANSAHNALSASSDFVLATSNNAISNLLALAGEYPEKNIIAIGSSENTALAMEVDFKTEESAFLCGVLASAVSQTGSIAYIGGLASDDMQSLIGFYTGAKVYNPNIVIYYDYVGSYNDYSSAYNLAQQYCANGVDVIFTNCGASALGVYDVVQSYGIKLINSDMYELPQSDLIIARSEKKYDVATSYAVEAFMNGEYTKSVVRIGLMVGAVDISLGDNIPQDIVTVINDYSNSIKQATTVVPSTWAEYNAYFAN